MPYKVLVVDDSTFFRRRVTEILNQDPDIQVIGEARNGQQAVEQVKKLDPDVVTMDIEMPIMDGITAVKKIMAEHPLPILMFSSLTYAGATSTLEAMDAGALDFLPKRFEDIARNHQESLDLLRQRVKSIARRKGTFRPNVVRTALSNPGSRLRSSASSNESRPAPVFSKPPSRRLTASGKKYRALAIGTSTGGPAALQNVLTKIPSHFPYPIILIQHMPGTFTKAFANRLDGLCKIKVVEGNDGDIVKAGTAYLAPGGKQMVLKSHGSQVRIHVVDLADSTQFLYKPSVDLTFSSVAEVYRGDVLAMVLTGMGADGREGSRKLKAAGAKIWAQDEQSCVVYGMPQAVVSAGLVDEQDTLENLTSRMLSEMR